MSNYNYQKSIAWLSATLALVVFAAIGCGESYDNPREKRMAEFDALDLEPGEAKPGIHLLPWIEVFEVDFATTDPLVTVESPERAEEVGFIEDIRFRGELVDELTQYDGLWPDDIIIGDDFMVIVSDSYEEDGELVVQGTPADITTLVHGKWDMSWGDAVANDPHHRLNPLMSNDAELDPPPLWAEVADNFGNVFGSFSADVDVERDEGKSYSAFGIDADGTSFAGDISLSPFSDADCEGIQGKREHSGTYVCIDRLTFKLNIRPEFLMAYKVEITGEYSNKVDHDALGALNFPGFPLGNTGLEFRMEPSLEVIAELDLSAQVDMMFKFGLENKLTLGFDYRHEGGVQIMPLNENGNNFDWDYLPRVHSDTGVSLIEGEESEGMMHKHELKFTLQKGWQTAIGIAGGGSGGGPDMAIEGFGFDKGIKYRSKNEGRGDRVRQSLCHIHQVVAFLSPDFTPTAKMELWRDMSAEADIPLVSRLTEYVNEQLDDLLSLVLGLDTHLDWNDDPSDYCKGDSDIPDDDQYKLDRDQELIFEMDESSQPLNVKVSSVDPRESEPIFVPTAGYPLLLRPTRSSISDTARMALDTGPSNTRTVRWKSGHNLFHIMNEYHYGLFPVEMGVYYILLTNHSSDTLDVDISVDGSDFGNWAIDGVFLVAQNRSEDAIAHAYNAGYSMQVQEGHPGGGGAGRLYDGDTISLEPKGDDDDPVGTILRVEFEW